MTNPLDIAGVECIREHFSLTPLQEQQFIALGELYRDWNAKINVISRKDIDNLYPHHIIHSLAIAKVLNFQPGTTLLDVGTGGGFPVLREFISNSCLPEFLYKHERETVVTMAPLCKGSCQRS